MKQLKVGVGHVYKVKHKNRQPFLPGEVMVVTEIDEFHVYYMYISDSWESKKEIEKFTTQWLTVPTKLEMYLLGATNVEMD